MSVILNKSSHKFDFISKITKVGDFGPSTLNYLSLGRGQSRSTEIGKKFVNIY